MEKHSTSQLTHEQILALRGLQLPQSVLRKLERTGIYCRPAVAIEHQHLANRYLLRGTESGGGVAGLGMYCSFADAEGNSLPWLERIDTVGVNGLHTIVLAPSLVRIQVLRYGQNYDLLITLHDLQTPSLGTRPSLENSILFHGRNGTLVADRPAEGNQLGGTARVMLYDRGGKQLTIPDQFQKAVLQVLAGAECSGCKHSHLLATPAQERTE